MELCIIMVLLKTKPLFVGTDGLEPPVHIGTDLQSARLPITGYVPIVVLPGFEPGL